MDEKEIDLADVLYAMSVSLRGINAELRAFRLEQRATLGMKPTEADIDALEEALMTADGVAALFGDDPEPTTPRVLS